MITLYTQNTNKESENTDWHVTQLPQIYCRKYKDTQHRIKLHFFYCKIPHQIEMVMIGINLADQLP
jgi:hypothetical protein